MVGSNGETIELSASLLSRLLRYGDGATRRRLADDVAAGDRRLVDLLAETARSDEALDLRIRCMEVLGLALEGADAATAKGVLTSLFGPGRI